jgi:hypothetical protein
MGMNRPTKNVETKTGANGQPSQSKVSANRDLVVLGIIGVAVFSLGILAASWIWEKSILGISVPALILAGYLLVNGLKRRMR